MENEKMWITKFAKQSTKRKNHDFFFQTDENSLTGIGDQQELQIIKISCSFNSKLSWMENFLDACESVFKNIITASEANFFFIGSHV